MTPKSKIQDIITNTDHRPSFQMKGFTLIELLISTAITAVALGLVVMFTLDISAFGLTFGTNLEAQQDLQYTMKVIATEIRSIGPADHGGYPITLANNTSFTFFSDIDDDGKFEQVRYFLDGTILKRGITKSSGVPPVYNPASESISETAQNVANGATPIFAFYDRNYAGSEPAIPTPADPSLIRLVRVVLTIDKDPLSPPAPMTSTLNVTIRNLRDNLQ